MIPVSGEDLYDTIERKGLRVYLEYPDTLPGIESGAPRNTFWERGVVSSDCFEPELEESRLPAIHGCHFVPVAGRGSHVQVRLPRPFLHSSA